jgi:hypothetical protein
MSSIAGTHVNATNGDAIGSQACLCDGAVAADSRVVASSFEANSEVLSAVPYLLDFAAGYCDLLDDAVK